MADLDKVKRNIRRMIAKGAPEEDIDAYLGGEGVTAEQLRGGGSPEVPTGERMMRGFNNAVTFGLYDNIVAHGKTLFDQDRRPYDERYTQNLARERARTSASRTQGVTDLPGLAGETAGYTVQGIAALPRQAANVGAQAVNAVRSVVAPQTTKELVKDSTRLGAAYGALGSYGQSDADPGQQVLDTIQGAAGGAALGYALPKAIMGYNTYVREPLQAGQAARAQAAQRRAADFEEAGIRPFSPALSESNAVGASAQGLSNTLFGSELRKRAADSIDDLSEQIARTIGNRSVNEAGQEVQGTLRRNLTEYSLPHEEIKAMRPDQLQDISTVAPGPAWNPTPPRVAPVQPRPITPINEDDIIRQHAQRIRPTEPAPITPVPAREIPDMVPQYKTPTIDEIPNPSDLAARYNRLLSDSELLKQQHVAAMDDLSRSTASGSQSAYDAAARRVDDIVERYNFAQTQINDVTVQIERSRQQALAQRAKDMRLEEDMRVAEYRNTLAQKRAEAAREAEQETRRLEAEARLAAEADTARRQQEAIERIRPNARAAAEAQNRQAENLAFSEAQRASRLAQQEADERFQAEVQRRIARGTSEPIQIGRSRESYPTEFEAGYQQVSGNARVLDSSGKSRAIQPEIMGPGTRTSRLVSEIGEEARGRMLLPNYRPEMGLTPQLAAYLESRVGSDVITALQRYAQPGFKPGIKGLRDIRTALGRAIGQARRAQGAPGNTVNYDTALMERLYAAMSDDMADALAANPIAQSQYRQLDALYRSFMNDVRRPLSRLFREGTTPEQAVDRLYRAATEREGNIDLLRAAFNVFEQKSDRAAMTSAILTRMTEGGLEGFLTSYRALSPEARQILFSGTSRHIGVRIDRLARVGGYLERYGRSANRDQSITIERATRPGNILLALTGYVSLPMALKAAIGAELTSRVMASRAFGQWLQKMPKVIENGARGPDYQRHMNRLRAILQGQLGVSEEIAEQAIGSIMMEPAK